MDLTIRLRYDYANSSPQNHHNNLLQPLPRQISYPHLRQLLMLRSSLPDDISPVFAVNNSLKQVIALELPLNAEILDFPSGLVIKNFRCLRLFQIPSLQIAVNGAFNS